MLSNLGIGEEHHFTLMADLEAKLRFVFFWHKLFLKPDLLWMSLLMIWILRLLNG
jgi:hypothetical protein